MRVHRVLFLVVTAAVMLSSAVFAGGNRQTVVTTQAVSTPDDFPSLVLADCGDFQVLQDWAGIWRIITHYNERGNVVDLNWHSRILESWVYNNSDPEIGFPGPTSGVERDRIDFESGLLYFTINIRIKVPGEGMVLRETGRVVLDLNSGEILFNSGQK